MKLSSNVLKNQNIQEKGQSCKLLMPLLVASILSLFSWQAQALNLIPNPGSVGDTFTIKAGNIVNYAETLDSGNLDIFGTFNNYGVSSETRFHVLDGGQLNNYGYLAWVAQRSGGWDQVDDGATVTNQINGTMIFGTRGGKLLDWHGGTLKNLGLIRVLGGRFIFEGGEVTNATSGKFKHLTTNHHAVK